MVGLEGIQAVGSLRIVDNDELAFLSNLDSMVSIKYLEIDNNKSLVSLSGLDNLSLIGSSSWVDFGTYGAES
ncbi:MAG: hypothetical protein IPN76_03590 [Saprospiraceae bacterium]|nr:hypothetical protein [Saprospiraceae bacterium]